MLRRTPLLLVLLAATACTALRDRTDSSAACDPRQAEVPLSTVAEDWNAFLVVDNAPTGIWTVRGVPLFEQYACPEVIGLDDRGRCLVCISYSGKWTPVSVIEDGKWLGGLDFADVDPRIAGSELYTGGQRGNLYQVVAYRHAALDCRLIAHLPGLEIHTVLAGDLDPSSEGAELLVFTRPGALYRITPSGADGTFETTLLEELPGRVRDAVLLEDATRGRSRIATVSRAGRLELLELSGDGRRWSTIHEAPMGKGRIAAARTADGRQLLYSTHDDGRVLRHEECGDGWRTQTIYVGPQGPRGLAAGRFHEDPGVESLAVFGYGKEVELLTRTDEGWRAETLFRDRDKGHWLATAELDGRNATDELLASGYGARIVLLARPPGYGLEEGLATGGER